MNSGVNERGQAAVEAALILPMVLFVFFGILQMALLHQARIITEYAAYKAARSGAVYRADCTHMKRAALLGLAPLLWEGSEQNPELRLAQTANRILQGNGNVLPRRDNRPPSNVPAVLISYKVDPITCRDGRHGTYDYALRDGCSPMRMRVKLTHFAQASIPFAGDIIARVWLAAKTGEDWARGGNDPTMLASRPNRIQGNMGGTSPQVLNWARMALNQRRPVIPVQATWSLRMHSDPLGHFDTEYQCF